MAKIIEAKSTIFSVFMRSTWGLFNKEIVDPVFSDLDKNYKKSRKSPVGFWDIITPWRITVDLNSKLITIRKRNWYLIGVNENVFAFKSVRQVNVKNHLFGADIGIRMYTGFAAAYSVSKSAAKEIRDVLMNNDWAKNDSDVIIGHGGGDFN